MDTYSASPYPLLDGKNGADTPGAFFFRRKDSKDTNMKPVSPNNQSQQPRSSSSCYEPSIAQSDATTLVPDNNQRIGASAVCPTTPPHGSRGTSWSSYRDLPSGHPVFEYSDEVRAELYERGVDPVIQAEVDAAKQDKRSNADSSRVQGFWKQSASRLKTFAAC